MSYPSLAESISVMGEHSLGSVWDLCSPPSDRLGCVVMGAVRGVCSCSAASITVDTGQWPGQGKSLSTNVSIQHQVSDYVKALLFSQYAQRRARAYRSGNSLGILRMRSTQLDA